MTSPVPTHTAPYPMTNHDPLSTSHHGALAELLDPDTCQYLFELGDDWAGAHCLEVGAGAGSIAHWLAATVGEVGRVVAIDREANQIPHHPRLTVIEQDLRSPRPLPPGPYDLIHARLVLAHLPEREAILDRLIGLLAPGGTILIEDWAPLRTKEQMVIAAPDPVAAELLGRYQETVGRRVFEAFGSDPRWARGVHSGLLCRGLTDVETRVRNRYWTGGDAGCRLVASVLAQLRPYLLRAGMTDGELGTVLMLLADPRLVLHGHPMYATSGRAST